MRNPFKKNTEKSELEKAIDERIAHLNETIEDSEKDQTAIDNLKQLVDAKTELEGEKHSINPNVIISAVGSLAGIVLIIKHENLNVITSKALSFVPKIFKG